MAVPTRSTPTGPPASPTDAAALKVRIRQTAVYSQLLVRHAQERLDIAAKRVAQLRQLLARAAEARTLQVSDVERLTELHVEHAARERDRVIAVLSHELRQPLNAALAASHLLHGSKAPSIAGPAHAVLDRQLRHMVRLLDDLQELAKIKTNTIVLQSADLDVTEAVEAAVETVMDRAANSGIALSVEKPREAVPVTGDAKRLRQVFINLLSNALSHTPRSGSVRVVITAASPNVTVQVIDSGYGIEPGELAHIFEPFRKGSSGTSEGLGIGLAIVRSLVEAHHGAVFASSAGPDRGSTFTVALPLVTPR
jgi:signal transduction histidine kinase